MERRDAYQHAATDSFSTLVSYKDSADTSIANFIKAIATPALAFGFPCW